jgi:thymidylate synthase (FAD)
MKIKVLDITKNPAELVDVEARSCYNSIPKPEARSKFLTGLIKSGHESPIEHAKLSVCVSDVSRAFTHQLVRHRLFSFTQQSQRYVKFGDDIDHFIVPDSILKNEEARKIYGETLVTIVDNYHKLCDLGIKKEDARMLLPNAAETMIVATANFREWRHFFEVRAEKHAQWEIRKFALSILHWLATNEETKDFFIDQAEKFFADLPEDFEIAPVEA